MQIKNIHLVNYRGMEDLTVEFGSGVNLIIGDNGAGKSSLLSGISVILDRSFRTTSGIAEMRTIRKEDVRFTSSTIGDATDNISYHTPVEIICSFEAWGAPYSDKCKKNNEDSNVEITVSPIVGIMKNHVEDNNSILPLVNFQEDKRKGIETAAKTTMQFEIKKPHRRQGYHDCLISNLTFDVMEKWSLYMELDKAQSSGHEAKEYGLFRKIVSSFIKEIDDRTKDPQVRFSLKQMQLTYSAGGYEQPIRTLSAGYQSVLCLIMELAYRTALLNPRLDDLNSLEGVVLIDEIDIHLHPRWQWKILGALRATFPNVQFIIATHSPIVISSAEDAKLILMENPNKVKYLPDAYGYNIDDVLELTQGSVNMPQEVKNWRREIEQALDENDLRKAEGVIQAAKDKLGKDSTTVERMKDFLEVNKWIVEE